MTFGRFVSSGSFLGDKDLLGDVGGFSPISDFRLLGTLLRERPLVVRILSGLDSTLLGSPLAFSLSFSAKDSSVLPFAFLGLSNFSIFSRRSVSRVRNSETFLSSMIRMDEAFSFTISAFLPENRRSF